MNNDFTNVLQFIGMESSLIGVSSLNISISQLYKKKKKKEESLKKFPRMHFKVAITIRYAFHSFKGGHENTDL